MLSDPLFAAVVGAAVVQAAAWLWVVAGLARVRDAQPDPDAPAPPLWLSVVVAARDEAARLPALLDALAAQTHRDVDGAPLFEVVVVDDGSADATPAILARRTDAWADGGPALRVVTRGVDDGRWTVDGGRAAAGPDAEGSGKKAAVTAGLAAAAFDRVALTDGDCVPPPDWLATLARHAAPDGADDGAVLVGYGPLRRAPGWLNRFVRFETFQTALLAAAGAGWGRPWQAVGRNLSYPRDLPARLGGLPGASLSGDDDLLVQAAAHAGVEIRYVLDPRAHVPSDAPPTARAFWRQKRRHAAAGAHYATGALVGLGVLRLSALALWLGVPLHALATGRPTAFGVLALTLLVQRLAWRDAEAFGAEADLRLLQPLLDGAGALYHAAFALLGALPGPRRW